MTGSSQPIDLIKGACKLLEVFIDFADDMAPVGKPIPLPSEILTSECPTSASDFSAKNTFLEVRTHLGKSQEELGRALGLTATTIGRIERGGKPGDLASVYADLIARASPISVEEFRYLSGCSSDAQRVLSLCRSICSP